VVTAEGVYHPRIDIFSKLASKKTTEKRREKATKI
jgi:hypothetical protein